MESNIITDEVLRMHMVAESEKLLTEIKNDETGKYLFLIKVRVCIYRYNSRNPWGARTLIYENKGFVVSCFTRWKWYFRYLQALEQVKTPKQMVQIETISYVDPNRDKVLLKVLTNKLTAAKRDRTKIQFAIENGLKNKAETSLFMLDDDPDYLKALDLLSKKQQLISDLEAEIAQFSNTPCQ
jgi:hypothetical protein